MSPHWSSILSLLLLILVANGTPALAGLVLGPGRPIDGGRPLGDGQPIFGPDKTWRGLAASFAGCAAVAPALGLPWLLGIEVAAGAMLGDLISSFAKRRLARSPGGAVLLLDQIPEALIPGFWVREDLGLAWSDLGIAILAFFLLDLLLTPLGRTLVRLAVRLSRALGRGP